MQYCRFLTSLFLYKIIKCNRIYLHYNTVYTHPTSSGNKHIPSGGSAGQILRWSSDGTAVWGSDNNTTYSTGTSSASGLTKLYGGTGSATDGTMTQSAITSALNGLAGKVISTITDVTGTGVGYFYIKRKTNLILYALINTTDASSPVTGISTETHGTGDQYYTIRLLNPLTNGKVYRFYELWISFVNS